METAGVFGETREGLLKKIGRRTLGVTGDCRETYWLEQRIGLAVQRCNALSILPAVRDRHGVRCS